MRHWRRTALLALVGTRVLFSMANDSPAIIHIKDIVCCTGRFQLAEVLTRVRLPAPQSGLVQLLRIRQRKEEPTSYISSAHASFNYLRGIFWQEWLKKNGIAYLVQSTHGAVALLWSLEEGKYEEKLIWGRDILRLDSRTRIVHLAPARAGTGGIDPSIVTVWVWTSGEIGLAEAKQIIQGVRERLGVQAIELYGSPQPCFWGTTDFPWIIPVFGILGEKGIREAVEAPRVFCDAPSVAGEVRCW